MALTTAAEYAKAHGYSEDLATILVHPGSEPGMFTCNFLGWDAEATAKKFVDSYEVKLAAAMAGNAADEAPPKRMSVLKKTPSSPGVNGAPAPALAPAPAPAPAPAASANYADPSSLKLTVAELQADRPDVDPTRKEAYLSDADFEKLMKSSRAEFNAMKGWKQAQVKKAAGLY